MRVEILVTSRKKLFSNGASSLSFTVQGLNINNFLQKKLILHWLKIHTVQNKKSKKKKSGGRITGHDFVGAGSTFFILNRSKGYMDLVLRGRAGDHCYFWQEPGTVR
jgi:hypothetical protein